MSIMEIISNLNLLYLALAEAYKSKKGLPQEMAEMQMTALKRAIQILISIDLKNEMEQENG